MQKCAASIAIALFILTIFLPLGNVKGIASPEKQTLSLDDTVLDVKIIDEPYASIKNVGNADAINVKWEMWLQCSILFISPGRQSGNINRLAPGSEEIVSYDMSNSFIFGFGVLKLKAVAKADNADTAEDVRPIGLLIGSYILIFS